jgi:zinc transport system permease protein
MDNMVGLALAAGFLVALPMGPLGAVVVWQRMAYLGDAISHAALLGVALAMAVHWLSVPLAILLVALAVALLLTHLTRDARLQHDTVLGLLAHGGLALGVVLFSLTGNSPLDLHAFLFGDILMVTARDVLWLALGSFTVGVLLVWQWRNLVRITIHLDLAAMHGVNVKRVQQGFVCVLAAMIALATPIVGALLITALLVIPAATARLMAKSPTQMAVIASLCAMVSVAVGLVVAFQIDTPASPTMVVVAMALFSLCSVGLRVLKPL